MTPTEEVQSQITEHRKANAARRARAFCDGPDRVLGFAVRRMTLPTCTLLHAIGSRFTTGETPMEGDVRNYLWLHSRLFTDIPFIVKPLRWLALLPFSAALHRQKDVDYYCAVIAMAANDIQGIIADVFADSPRGQRKDGSPAQGCLEAQLIHLFVKEYGWTPAFIRKQPLAQLIQLARQFGGDDEDAQEKEIKFAHLRKRNDELAKEREAKKIIADLTPSV